MVARFVDTQRLFYATRRPSFLDWRRGPSRRRQNLLGWSHRHRYLDQSLASSSTNCLALILAEKTSKKAMAGISLEEQINSIHRSQGLIDDDGSAGHRIGPVVPRPTSSSTYSSSAKTIQKPPQLSTMIAKPMVTIAAPPQRTIVANPMLVRPGMQSVAMLPPAGHTMVSMPPMMAMPHQAGPMHAPPMMDEPSAKRAKTEEQLIPEEEFYKTFGKVTEKIDSIACLDRPCVSLQGQVTITVQLPVVGDKPEWNLNGQAIPLTMPITDPVRSLTSRRSGTDPCRLLFSDHRHQSETVRFTRRHASRQTEASLRRHVRQRLEFTWLLQHDERLHSLPTNERTRWSKEITSLFSFVSVYL